MCDDANPALPRGEMRATTILDNGSVRVTDYRCDAGPSARPFAELHDTFSIAYVRSGSFGYACRGKRWDLVPGSVLIGRPGEEYVCSHEHVCGDECLGFSLAPELAEAVDASRALWRIHVLPPVPQVLVFGELAQAAVEQRVSVAMDEAVLLLAGRVAALAGASSIPAGISARDRKRTIEAARWIETHATEPIDLQQVADHVGLSRYHFVRIFARVLGVTPHQHLLRARVRLASRMLAGEDHPVTEVALEAGFGDLSNFVRTFGRAAGMSPGAFRRKARADRNFRQVQQGRRGLR
jgi:AraC-like DNA-binding protein